MVENRQEPAIPKFAIHEHHLDSLVWQIFALNDHLPAVKTFLLDKIRHDKNRKLIRPEIESLSLNDTVENSVSGIYTKNLQVDAYIHGSCKTQTGEEKQIHIFIENKIDAIESGGDQFTRYRRLCDSLRANDPASIALCWIIAPERYMANPQTNLFDQKIKIEEISNLMAGLSKETSDPAGTALFRHLTFIAQKTIEKDRYSFTANEQISRLCLAYQHALNHVMGDGKASTNLSRASCWWQTHVPVLEEAGLLMKGRATIEARVGIHYGKRVAFIVQDPTNVQDVLQEIRNNIKFQDLKDRRCGRDKTTLSLEIILHDAVKVDRDKAPFSEDEIRRFEQGMMAYAHGVETLVNLLLDGRRIIAKLLS